MKTWVVFAKSPTWDIDDSPPRELTPAEVEVAPSAVFADYQKAHPQAVDGFFASYDDALSAACEQLRVWRGERP
jgi:hypothetical protein